MRDAENVTFGGSGFDRATHFRKDEKAIAGLAKKADARAMAVWRGKPLVSGEKANTIVWLPMDHAILSDGTPQVFLGLDGKAPRFAADVSAWLPENTDLNTIGSFFDASEQVHPQAPKGARYVDLRRIMARLSAQHAELAASAVGLFTWHRNHRFCSRCGKTTRVSLAGWQRRCEDCNAMHFPRVDPVVIMLVTLGNDVLVGRSHSWPEGMYSLLAGFMEPGETIEAAVRREVLEESNVKIGQVDYLASQPWPYPSSLMIGAHGHALSRDIMLDPVELEDAKWVSREEMMASLHGATDVSMAARKGSIAHFLTKRWLSDTLD